MGLGIDCLNPRAETGEGALQAVVEEAAGALGFRRQVPAGTHEEVLTGVLDP